MDQNRVKRFCWAALLAPAAFAVPADAAPVTASSQTHANVLQPLSLLKVQDLDFGVMASTATAGTAVINADTGARTVTGGVVALGGTVTRAHFLGAGAPRTNVAIIKEPKGSINLIRVGGTETMVLDNFDVDGNGASRPIGTDRVIDFYVGGTLHVNANQAKGTYLGVFVVTVNYN
jgi:hypothetical protein